MSKAWSDDELAASVDAYREMLAKELAGIAFVKARIYRELAKRFSRDEGAFERRMQNISAIYEDMGLKRVTGLAPLKKAGTGIKARLMPIISAMTVNNPAFEDIARVESEALLNGVFDLRSIEDSRERVLANIVRRRGQAVFRNKLMDAYGCTCAISGCDVSSVLEAAHIHPYKGKQTNMASNGLLLRADIHTLFDIYLIAIDPKTMLIQLAPQLSHSQYAQYEGTPLRPPTRAGAKVSVEALQWHLNQCHWIKSPIGSWG